MARGATCGERGGRCSDVPSSHLHHVAKGVMSSLRLCLRLRLFFWRVDSHSAEST